MKTKNVTCLIAEMKIVVNFTYATTGKPNKIRFKFPLNYALSYESFIMIVLYGIHNTVHFADNKTKEVSYQIPVNETSVDQVGSSCGEKEDILMVSWKTNNSFYMKFNANDSHYDLSSFVVTLNTSSLFIDSAGESKLRLRILIR